MSQEPIGKYRIEGVLGEGGMGIVYRGYDASLDRFAALKVMNENCRSQEEFRVRFFREARSAAALNHDNIITIYELNEDPQQPFIAMEFVEGPSLQALIRSRQFIPFQEKLRIVTEVCQGLAHAHQRGVVHRDVKPDNILIGQDGKAKILDFGISRFVTGAGEGNLTQAGTVMGSPNYMSPEQAAGETGQIGVRSDIFSLGSVFFEFLTGFPPFHSQNTTAIYSRILTQPHPSLTAAFPGFPEELSRIIDRALAKNPQERQDAAQMAADVKAFRIQLPRYQQELSLRVQELEAQLQQALSQLPDEKASRFRMEPREGDPADFGNLLWRSRELHRHLEALHKNYPGLVTVGRPHFDSSGGDSTADLPLTVVLPTEKKGRWKWVAAASLVLMAAALTLFWLVPKEGAFGFLFGDSLDQTPELSKEHKPEPDLDAPTGPPVKIHAKGGTMVLIPTGEFVFGSPFGEGRFDKDNNYENESPQRTLYLGDFYIDMYEVTNREFLEFCRQTARPEPPSPTRDPNYTREKLDHPVIGVDWKAAQAFCSWAGKRLPTEMEWEKAARGSQGNIYPWGNEFKPGLANLGAGLDESEFAAASGTFPDDRSPFGVMDMAGNVSEWVQDDYQLYPDNPSPLPGKEKGRKVARGGFFRVAKNLDSLAKASYRYPFKPETAFAGLGFRCSADVESALGQAGGGASLREQE